MPQYAFRAVDGNNYMVEGTVEADDPMQAGDQIRRMGYAPQQVRAVPVAPVAVVSGYGGGRPGPIDLTQEYVEPPTVGPSGELVPPLELGRSDMASRMAKLEPWERSVGVSDGTEPTQQLDALGAGPTQTMPSLNGNGYPGPTQAMPAYAGRSASGVHAREGRPGGGAIPYGPGGQCDVSLKQRALETLVYPIRSGVVLKQLSPFLRQFSTLINAGLPLYQALVALEGNTQNAKLKEVALAAQRQVQEGGRFSDVMAAYPWIFSPMQVELVRAGEMGGNLDRILVNIADYVDHELEVRRLLSRETIYPKLVLFVALMLLGKDGLLDPLHKQMAIVRLVIGSMGKDTYTVGHYFNDTVGFMLLCLIPILTAVAIFRLFLFNIDSVREGYDTFKMSVPGVGALVKMFSTAKFCRTFATLYRSGISMGTALQIAGNASGNAVVRRAAYRAIPRAERGELVSMSLQEAGIFSPLTVDMFRTGETSGNLDTMADKIADYYEAEGKLKVHQNALLFSVVVLLLVLILVGYAVINQYLQMASREMSAAGGDE